MKFRDKLQYLLEKNNVSVPRLSEATGISSQTIYSILKRDGDKTKLSHLLKLCDFFHCTLDYLVDDNITNPTYGKRPIEKSSRFSGVTSEGKYIANIPEDKIALLIADHDGQQIKYISKEKYEKIKATIDILFDDEAEDNH